MTAKQTWPGGIVLAALPAKGECMTLDRLVEKTGIERDRIVNLITTLNGNGLVNLVRAGCYRRSALGDATLTRSKPLRSGPRGPKKRPIRSGGLTERLWKALRLMRKATLPELLEIADPRELKTTDHAERYLRVLARHGITARAKRKLRGAAPTSNGFAQHILVRDLGPKAPVWRSTTSELFDPNSAAIIARPDVQVEISHV